MRYQISYKILLMLSLLAATPNSYAQKKQPSASSYPKVRFIVAAPVLVPRLVEEGKWDATDDARRNII